MQQDPVGKEDKGPITALLIKTLLIDLMFFQMILRNQLPFQLTLGVRLLFQIALRDELLFQLKLRNRMTFHARKDLSNPSFALRRKRKIMGSKQRHHLWG